MAPPVLLCQLLLSITFLSSCNAQPLPKAPVVITNDTVPIPGEWPVRLSYEGQLCHWVRNMLQDSRGALWFGTNHYGVIRYQNDTLEYFADSVGITGGRINGIVEDREGNVWLATDGEGLFKYDPTDTRNMSRRGFCHYTTKDGLLHNEIWSMTMGRDGTIWLGTMDGLCRFDPSALPTGQAGPLGTQAFTTVPIPAVRADDTTAMLSPTRITCILEDSKGNIWLGRDAGGLFKFDPSAMVDGSGTAFTHYTTEDGLSDNSVTGLMEDSRGNLWIGSSFGGVSRYNGKTFENFTKDGVIEGMEVGAFYEDKKGNIWFAAENFGVYRYDPSALPTGQAGSLRAGDSGFTNYYTEDGLDTNGILAILQDREGRFWFGGWKGLFRFDPSLRQALEGPASLRTGGKRFFHVTKTGPWN
ncbi:MAG TPA: two-component regulator propeller domain-containing protein [Flavobacteriales bacterium]|nr:two-component regulator propeller domain-containing protein [Flavobacteriales bacterium]